MWLQRHERNAARCPKCNGDREKCSDPAHTWYPQRSVCYAEMEVATANRLYDLLHKDRPYHDGTFTNWAEEPSVDFPCHYRDGVSIWVAPVDLAPDDNFTTDPNAVPSSPRGGDRGDQA